jgi:Fe-S cluster assembly protein SufD
MASAFAERLTRELTAAGPAVGPHASATRRRALDALAQLGLPGSRDENWKYANLRALERVRFAPPAALADIAAGLALPARIAGFTRQVFVDGLHDPALSDALADERAIRVRAVGAGGLTLGTGAQHRDARFALLNTAFATDGIEITAPRAASAMRVELVYVAFAESSEAASYPRIHVTVEPGASLELIERHVAARDAASFIAPLVEITVGAGGRLAHYRLQEAAPRALWIDTLNAQVGADASYEMHTTAFGAISARSTALIQLAARGAHAGVHSVAVADRHQVLDAFVRVEHAAPATTTDEAFRGIAGGRSRVAFNGMVVVQRGARGADSRQSLRGLLAGPEAEIDARPQLEIYTDEVCCSHGATAGTLDESMLFYLLSRGIDPATARNLLEWAFLEDVVAKIGIADLRRHIEAHLATRLRSDTDLRELL